MMKLKYSNINLNIYKGLILQENIKGKLNNRFYNKNS